MAARVHWLEICRVCACCALSASCAQTHAHAPARSARVETQSADLEHCWEAFAGPGPAGAATRQRYCFAHDRYLWRRMPGEPWQQGDVSWMRAARGDQVVFRSQLHFDAAAEPIDLAGSRELEVTFSPDWVSVGTPGARSRAEIRRVSAAEERALWHEISMFTPVRALCEHAQACAEQAVGACNEKPPRCDELEPLESTSHDCQRALDRAIAEFEKRELPLPEACALR